MRKTAVFFVFLLVCFTYAQEQKKVTDFTLKNMKGEEVSLSDFSGKIVVLEWFTTWCAKCREAFPEIKPFLNRLNKEYSGNVKVLAINLDKKELATVSAFVEKKGIEYSVLHDPDGITGKTFNLSTLPLIVIIDKDGIIVKKFQGHKKNKTTKEIEDAVKSLIAGK